MHDAASRKGLRGRNMERQIRRCLQLNGAPKIRPSRPTPSRLPSGHSSPHLPIEPPAGLCCKRRTVDHCLLPGRPLGIPSPYLGLASKTARASLARAHRQPRLANEPRQLPAAYPSSIDRKRGTDIDRARARDRKGEPPLPRYLPLECARLFSALADRTER